MRTRRTRVNRNLGFNLVELLVVVSIISLIAAIAFPMMSRAKSRAKDSASLTILRQLGQAYSLYAIDNNDYSPYVGNTFIIHRLETGQASYADFPDFLGQKSIKGALAPYTRAPELWRSPADPGEAREFIGTSNFLLQGSSYDSISASFCIGSLSQLTSPSEAGLLREASPYRRNMAFTWRSDGSVKLLPWLESGSQLDNSMRDFGCIE